MVTISSRRYKNQLIELFYGDFWELVKTAGEDDFGFYMVFEHKDVDIGSLCELFEDLILGKDELLASSPRLYENVRELVFAHKRGVMALGLESFLAENDGLCLEGYIDFCLGIQGYSARISNILYQAVKHILNAGGYFRGGK